MAGRGAFVDFAAGRNENVITFKEGNKYEQVCWRDANVMSSIGRCIVEFNQRGLLPSETYGDAGGMGVAIISRFHEMGWPIIAVNNDADPINPIYENLGSGELARGEQEDPEPERADPERPDFVQAGDDAAGSNSRATGYSGWRARRTWRNGASESPDRFDSMAGAMTDRHGAGLRASG